MSTASLTQHLQVLADSLKENLRLIQELQQFPNNSTFAHESDPDEKRLELGNDIHQSLKEWEDQLEFIRQEVEGHSSSRSRQQQTSSFEERERNAATIARFTEDLRSARSAFRRAQLQAKRNADNAKRKEREALFANRTNETPAPRRKGQEKLTQDELALNAAEDVTRSLRRAHDLLSGNIQQSQFAQQTLDESSEALRTLDESYGGTTDLLRNSRGLVTQLLKSQKSDTWYLLTSFYVMAGTLIWLIFRRLLYGPLWWLVYQPIRLLWWTTLVSLGTIGFGGFRGGITSNGTAVAISDTATTASVSVPAYSDKSAISYSGSQNREASYGKDESPEMIEQIGKMLGNDWSATGAPQMSETPRNTKKRMMEVNVGHGQVRDEL